MVQTFGNVIVEPTRKPICVNLCSMCNNIEVKHKYKECVSWGSRYPYEKTVYSSI